MIFFFRFGTFWMGGLLGILAIGTDSPAANGQDWNGPVSCSGKYKHHLQGICQDGEFIYWSFTTTLVKTDQKGIVVRKVPVANHHGDLCHVKGKLFVAVNLGRFNDPAGNADSWIYVYDSMSLKQLARHPVPEVFHGAGGMSHAEGHFFVVGGLPKDVPVNFVYEYDTHFKFVKKHSIESGTTHLGIQTATRKKDRWYFGCYGSPAILLVTDDRFRMVGRYKFDCSLGVEALSDGRLLVARGKCGDGCVGSLRVAWPSSDRGITLEKPKKGKN